MQNEILTALIGGLSGAIVAQLTSSFDKSKILFEKRLEALSTLHVINANLLGSYPEQMGAEWSDDILPDLVNKFTWTQKELERLRDNYAATLADEELDCLNSAIQSIVNGSVVEDSDNIYTPNNEQMKYADEMFDHIESLKRKMNENIEKQTQFLPFYYLKRILTFTNKIGDKIKRHILRAYRKIRLKLGFRTKIRR